MELHLSDRLRSASVFVFDNVVEPFLEGRQHYYLHADKHSRRAREIMERRAQMAPQPGEWLHPGILNGENRRHWKELQRTADETYETLMETVATRKHDVDSREEELNEEIATLEAQVKTGKSVARQKVIADIEQKKENLERVYQQTCQQIAERTYPRIRVHDAETVRTRDMIAAERRHKANLKKLDKQKGIFGWKMWIMTRQLKRSLNDQLKAAKTQCEAEILEMRQSYEPLETRAKAQRKRVSAQVRQEKVRAWRMTAINWRRAWAPIHARLHRLEHHLQAFESGIHVIERKAKPKIKQATRRRYDKIKTDAHQKIEEYRKQREANKLVREAERQTRAEEKKARQAERDAKRAEEQRERAAEAQRRLEEAQARREQAEAAAARPESVPAQSSAAAPGVNGPPGP